jgi:hypothetical protein
LCRPSAVEADKTRPVPSTLRAIQAQSGSLAQDSVNPADKAGSNLIGIAR